jgi:DNA-binding NarL/FixJ family response regulator
MSMRVSTNTALIVDHDEFFRLALRTVLTSTLGFSVALEAESFDQAITLLSEKKIDLAVFDLMMPGMAGPGSLRGVRDHFPDLCLVMCAASDRREDILWALQAGVNGYIPKDLGLKQFSSALKQILEGKVYVPASIASPSIAGSADEIAATAVSDPASTLTPRQKDILTLVVKGHSMFRVFGVHSRSAVAAKGAMIVLDGSCAGASLARTCRSITVVVVFSAFILTLV